MMGSVTRTWQEMLPLELPVEGAWCSACALPSLATRRFLHTLHNSDIVSHAQVLTLVHCRDCEDTYWKEYREAADTRDNPEH